MLIQSGLGFIVVGALIVGSKTDKKLKRKFRENRVVGMISGNLGGIFFIIGVVLLIAGVVDLYY